jgi:hypothetical protein
MPFLSQEQKQRATLNRRCKDSSNFVEDPGSGDDKALDDGSDDEASEDSGDDESSEDSGANESPEGEEDIEFLDLDETGDSQEEFSPSDTGSDDSELDYDDSDASPDENGVSKVPSAIRKRTELSSNNGPNTVCQQNSRQRPIARKGRCTRALLCKQLPQKR